MITPTLMEPAHRGYVCSTWAYGQRLGLRRGPAFKLVNRIVDVSTVFVLASGPTVHAWACGDGEVLHYVYVPPELRHKGMAKQLITALFQSYPDRIRVTHPWPAASDRYQYVPHGLLEAAA